MSWEREEWESGPPEDKSEKLQGIRHQWTNEEKDEIIRKIGITMGWGEPSAPFHKCPKNIVESCNDSCKDCLIRVGNERGGEK